MSNTFNDTIEKVYYHVGEVSEMFNVNPSCLRYWESTFGLKVMRRHGDKRFYTKENIDDLKEIHRLLKVEEFTIQGALKKFKRTGA